MSSAAARTHAEHGPTPEELYPMLRAENAEVLIHPSDRKYGALLVGGILLMYLMRQQRWQA